MEHQSILSQLTQFGSRLKSGQNPRDTPHLVITDQTTAGSAVSAYRRSSAFSFPSSLPSLGQGFGSDARVQGPWGKVQGLFPVIRDGPTHSSLPASCTPYRKFSPSSCLAAAFRHSGRVSVRATAAQALAMHTILCSANLFPCRSARALISPASSPMTSSSAAALPR